MDSPRAIARRALDELKPYLVAYVNQALASVPGARRPTGGDTYALLGAVLDNWDNVFARTLSRPVRHYARELKDVRNRWAHEVDFSYEDAHRAADTARLIAKEIGAPPRVLDTLAVLAGRRPEGAPGATAPRPDARPPSPEAHDRQPVGRSAAPRPLGDTAVPRRDARGVIINAAELMADQVSEHRVLCPACEKKVFDTWPFGWDAHAAHVCSGIPPGSETERKAEYRRRFGYLFKGSGARAARRTQRELMRELCARFALDHERVIREYADAERRGEVGRAHNKSGLTPEGYARALLADGLKKGWLTC